MIFLTCFSTFENKIKKVFATRKPEKLKYNYTTRFLQTSYNSLIFSLFDREYRRIESHLHLLQEF